MSGHEELTGHICSYYSTSIELVGQVQAIAVHKQVAVVQLLTQCNLCRLQMMSGVMLQNHMWMTKQIRKAPLTVKNLAT